MEFYEKREYILSKISCDDAVLQLVEECSELIQACLKYHRSIKNRNIGTLNTNEAYQDIIEEFGDVLCVAEVFLNNEDYEESVKIGSEKLNRWVKRLEEHENKEANL